MQISTNSLLVVLLSAFFASGPPAYAQVSFDYIGSTPGLWDYYTPKNYTLDTSMGGSIESEQYVFLEYLSTPFTSLPFSPGSLTFTIRGNFNLFGDAFFAQGISILDSVSPFRYFFAVAFGKTSTDPDIFGVFVYDGFTPYIYNLEPPAFEWTNQGGTNLVTYVINLTPTPTGILLTGDLYDNSLLIYSFNDTFPNPFPALTSYDFRPFMSAGGSNIVTATPVIQDITTLDWQVSVIPEPTTPTVLLTVVSLIIFFVRKKLFLKERCRTVQR